MTGEYVHTASKKKKGMAPDLLHLSECTLDPTINNITEKCQKWPLHFIFSCICSIYVQPVTQQRTV